MEAAVGNEPAFLLQGVAKKKSPSWKLRSFSKQTGERSKTLSLCVVIKAEMFPFQNI